MEQQEKNFKNIAVKFIHYFNEEGFCVITEDVNLRVVRMEHEDGRDVILTTNSSGLDFVIHGNSFKA